MSRDALVVGINTYTHLRNLRTPATDAEAIAQRLEQDGEFRVRRLPEAIHQSEGVNQASVGETIPVSKTQLKRAIVELFKPNSTQVSETALLYFSGHGIRDDLGIQEGYLASSDANPQADEFGLSLSWLRHLLAESPIQQQVVWLDCCHSGALLVNVRDADPGDRGKGKHRCFIASSRDYQSSWQDLNSPYSVLTKALLAGLDPARQLDRWVTNISLTDFINQSLQGELQTPICNNSGEPINLTRNWRGASLGVDAAIAPDRFCPYKGLEYFDAQGDDPKYFFGREVLTDQLLDQVRQSNFVAIVGASGSGKSSVLRAGLLHQLKLGYRVSGSDQWQIVVMRPDAQPLHNLALAVVAQETSQIDRAVALDQVKQLLDKGAVGLERLVAASTAARVVLVVDQFEEVFTLCQDTQEREKFFACLLGSLEQMAQRLCVVIAIRADFVGRCLEKDYSGLAEHIERHLVSVRPMNREELATVICKPAALVGLEVEPALVEQMVADIIDEPGGLPLLEYTLTELWKEEQKRNSACLQLETYQSALQGVRGTLDKRATVVYETQFSAAEQAVVRHIFLALTQLGEGTEDTRRRVLQQDLVTDQDSDAIVQGVLQILTDEKLVVTSKLEAKGQATEQPTVEVAHEILIRHWHLLRDWVQTNRENLRRERRLEYAYKEWRELAQGAVNIPEAELPWLRGAQLAEIEEWINTTHPPNLSQGEREFVEKSIEIRDRDLRQKRWKERQRWMLAAGLLATITIAFGGFAYLQWKSAIVSREGEVKVLVSLAKTQFDNHQQLESLVTSIQALEDIHNSSISTNKVYSSEVLNEIRIILNSIQERNRWIAHESAIMAVTVRPRLENLSNPDITIASASRNDTINLWSSRGELIDKIPEQEGTVRDLEFSPKGNQIALAGDTGIWLWDITDRDIDGIHLDDQDAFSLGFSQDGQRLVTSTMNGLIKIWDISRQEAEQIYDSSEMINLDKLLGITGVNFHPHNNNLVAYIHVLQGYKSLVKILDTQDNQSYSITESDDLVQTIRFSSDASMLAVSILGVIQLWDIKSLQEPKLIAELKSNDLQIYDINFSEHDQLLISGGADTEIRVWNIQSIQEAYQRSKTTLTVDKPEARLRGHSGDVNTVNFFNIEDQLNDQDLLIISGGDDRTLRIWDWHNNDPMDGSAHLDDDDIFEYGCSLIQNHESIDLSDQVNCP
jgi:hypothetical protein